MEVGRIRDRVYVGLLDGAWVPSHLPMGWGLRGGRGGLTEVCSGGWGDMGGGNMYKITPSDGENGQL